MACLGGSRPPPFYYEIWSMLTPPFLPRIARCTSHQSISNLTASCPPEGGGPAGNCRRSWFSVVVACFQKGCHIL
eukprot:2781182-Pyramimonas_sp.AAC.1